MKLNKLKLKNFRSYSQETEIDISDLNVIIGKNDVGKSSILKMICASKMITVELK